MPPSSSLWTGRRDGDDHEWMAQPAPPPIRRSLRPEPPPPPPPRRRPWRWVAAALAGAALLAGGLAIADAVDGEDAPQPAKPLPADTGGRPRDTRINEIYARVQAGVVSVQVPQGGGRGSSGTGFVVDGDGTVVTNAHVVGDASEARVRFEDDGAPVRAEVVGSDPSSDLAVLRVEPGAATFKPLPLADSDEVKVGDEAIAIGFPLGLERTATAGIVSGLEREIEAPNGFQIDEVIQTDAPINPGNSGGPLLDARGRVIGVNSQIASSTGGNIGIGFAVPSNTVREVVPQLKSGRSVRRPWLGVSTSMPVTGDGAVVRQVTPGGPAERAGIEAASTPTGQDGDRIVAIDGKPVQDPDDVADAIEDKAPGDEVRIEIVRDGDRRTVEVRLGVRPDRIP